MGRGVWGEGRFFGSKALLNRQQQAFDFLQPRLGFFFVRRGNLPPSVMKSPWRVSISLSSFTSMAVTDFSLARIFSSPTASSNSTGGGSGPKRSRNSFCKASSAGLSVACASLR